MRYFRIILIVVIIFVAVRCFQKNENVDSETILKGTTTIISDGTLAPIIEDQIEIFEDDYNAHINLVSKSEAEVINSLLNDSIQIAILSRDLTSAEKQQFSQRKIIPRITKFATDAITFIRNKNTNDTIIALADILNLMRGNESENIKGLVFDNLNSSTARYLLELSGMKDFPSRGIFSFKTNDEAIKYVAENEGMVGVVGLNWISQPQPAMQKYINQISVLSLKGLKDENYYSPTQNNLAEGKYPLARDLFVVNCQGYSGLGMGFASFVAGEKGQRIILKSGLLPIRIPGRNILIRNQVEKSK